MTLNSLGIALAYAMGGIALFACAFALVGKVLLGQLWKQALDEKNLAAAIILAAVALALGWIVAAVAH